MIKPKATVIINTVNEVPERLIKAISGYKAQIGVKMQVLVSTVENDPSILTAKMMGVECIVNLQAGIYEQLNNAMHYIKHDWWSYASGNDYPEPNKTIDEINCCINNNALICYSNFIKHRVDEQQVEFPKFPDYNYSQHLVGNFVNDCSIMHISLVEKYAPFRFHLWHNDSFWDFWLRVAEGEGEKAFCHNNERSWTYNIYTTSKHIVRQSNPSELQEYAEVRKRMIESHLQKKYDPKNNMPFHVKCEIPLAE